jgi:hypothetical protein
MAVLHSADELLQGRANSAFTPDSSASGLQVVESQEGLVQDVR